MGGGEGACRHFIVSTGIFKMNFHIIREIVLNLEPFACKKLMTNMYQCGLRFKIFTTDRSSLMKKLFK
jgi:hypothetical protein